MNELLQNAIQHGFSEFLTDEKAEVVIHFDSKDGFFEISVTDNGKGLPEKFADQSFGLGLTIVMNLIEADLGGDMRLLENTPSGTMALIRIPQLK